MRLERVEVCVDKEWSGFVFPLRAPGAHVDKSPADIRSFPKRVELVQTPESEDPPLNPISDPDPAHFGMLTLVYDHRYESGHLFEKKVITFNGVLKCIFL